MVGMEMLKGGMYRSFLHYNLVRTAPSQSEEVRIGQSTAGVLRSLLISPGSKNLAMWNASRILDKGLDK